MLAKNQFFHLGFINMPEIKKEQDVFDLFDNQLHSKHIINMNKDTESYKIARLCKTTQFSDDGKESNKIEIHYYDDKWAEHRFRLNNVLSQYVKLSDRKNIHAWLLEWIKKHIDPVLDKAVFTEIERTSPRTNFITGVTKKDVIKNILAAKRKIFENNKLTIWDDYCIYVTSEGLELLEDNPVSAVREEYQEELTCSGLEVFSIPQNLVNTDTRLILCHKRSIVVSRFLEELTSAIHGTSEYRLSFLMHYTVDWHNAKNTHFIIRT